MKRGYRRRADDLTIAFIALGAETARVIHGGTREDLGGQLEFIAECTQYALMLDRLADKQDGFDGVFCYDVAEVFGHQLALALLDEREVDVEELARELVYKHAYDAADREFLVDLLGDPAYTPPEPKK